MTNRSELSLQKLVKGYQAMNNSEVEEFDKEMPTELEFSSFIHSNRPLVVRSYHQKQSQSHPDHHYHISTIGSAWSEKILIDRLGKDKLLTVARTPKIRIR